MIQHNFHKPPLKHLGILSSWASVSDPSVIAVSPSLSYIYTTISPRTAIRFSHGCSSLGAGVVQEEDTAPVARRIVCLHVIESSNQGGTLPVRDLQLPQQELGRL